MKMVWLFIIATFGYTSCFAEIEPVTTGIGVYASDWAAILNANDAELDGNKLTSLTIPSGSTLRATLKDESYVEVDLSSLVGTGGDDLGDASANDVVGLFTGSTGYLNADGTIDTPDGDDLGGAAYGDVVGLFTGTTGYLNADGTISDPPGTTVYPDAGIPVSLGESGWDDSLTLDTDLTSVSASDDSLPSALATKTALDGKVDTGNMTALMADLDAIKILDSREAVDGSPFLDDTVDYGDTDDNLHPPSIEKVGAMLRPLYLHKSSSYTMGTDSADECLRSVTVFADAAATITACAYTANVMPLTVVATGNFAVSVDMNTADRMLRDGAAMDTGDKATSTSTLGDTAYCEPESADGWYCWTGSNDGDKWTDGGQ